MKRAEYEGLDAQILSLAQAGRRKEACALLVDSYGGEILGTCISRVGDAALVLCQRRLIARARVEEIRNFGAA